MEMYRTANPGMTVRPRPWPRRVASSTFKEENQSNGIVEGGFPLFVQNPQTTELSNQKKTRMRRSKRRLESRSALARFPFSRFNRMKFGRVEYAPWSIEGPVLEELK